MKESFNQPLSAGGLWVASGEVVLDANDLADTLGDPSADKVLAHWIAFPENDRPSSVPHVALSLTAIKARGAPHYRVTTGRVDKDGFTLCVGRENGAAIAFLGVRWAAIGKDGVK